MSDSSSTVTTKKNQCALVLGLGASGLSAVHHLRQLGFTVRAADTRTDSPYAQKVRQDYKGVNVIEGPFIDRLLEDVDLVVLSPGVSIDDQLVIEARRRQIDIAGDVELFARLHNDARREPQGQSFCDPSTVLGITGSNGKSTVTALTGELLDAAGKKVSVGGNIGQPVLTLRRPEHGHCYVIELSSFQLETVSTLRLKAATVLNLSEDHLDRHTTLQRYGAAKARIFRHADTAVVNRDDSASAALVPDSLSRISFGSDAPGRECDFGLAWIDGRECIVHGKTVLAGLDELHMPGRHNALNIMAALSLVSLLEVKPQDVIETAVRFEGLAHRMQTVARHGGVAWINDSKGTNVASTTAAVAGLKTPVILLVGGQAKNQDFQPLMRAAQAHVRELIVFGEDASLIERTAQTCFNATQSPTNIVVVADLDAAVKRAGQVAIEGDSVLFSPACASFDMFANFAERGDIFCQLVHELTGTATT